MNILVHPKSTFRYVRSESTDIRKTFARVRRQMKKKQAAAAQSGERK